MDTTTTTISISLSEAQWNFVCEQARTTGQGDPAEFICRLLDEEKERRAEAKVAHMLQEGLRSEVGPLTAHDWDEIRRAGRETLAATKSP